MSATLIIIGKSPNPDVITQHLKLKPSQAWKKGERKSFKKKDGSTHFFNSRYEWGGWKLWPTKTQRKKKIHKQIEDLINLLNRKKRALAQVRAFNYKIFIDCCIVGKSDFISLSSEMLAKLAALGVTFEVTFYAPIEKERNKGGVGMRAQGQSI